MPKSTCKICSHPERAEIENAILSMTTAPVEERMTIEVIAKEFDVDLNELKMHALFHTPLVSKQDVAYCEQSGCNELGEFGESAETSGSSEPDGTATPAVGRESLTRKMKLREADMLAAVSNEYLVTLKAMGRRLNKLTAVSSIDAEDDDKQYALSKMLTKPMVDLYIGLGGEIRQNVKVMAELDRMLNGPQDSTAGGLAALAQAIRGSDLSG